MRFRPLLSVALLLAFPFCALADTDIVVDDFESYSSAADLQASWVSVISPSAAQAPDPLTSTSLTNPVDALYTNYDGQAALFDGALGVGGWTVNQWQETAFDIAPSATQNIELSVDLGHDALTSNKKLTLGLRGPAGIIELGFWNQLPTGPGGEFFQFGYRNVLFSSGDTNWQGYPLDESLDQIFEVGDSAFHRFSAVISETDVTFSLDLFADGINNALSGSAADYDNDGDVDGEDFLVAQRDGLDISFWESEYGNDGGAIVPGPDATIVVPAVVDSGGFFDLRFGIPSGDGGFGGHSADPLLAVDNVSLRLVDIPLITAVPEPASATLVLLAAAGMLATRRR